MYVYLIGFERLMLLVSQLFFVSLITKEYAVFNLNGN